MRLAASTYLNSAPLVYSFSSGSQRLALSYEFVGHQAPAVCAALLAAGEVEIALIPVIEYQRIPDLLLIPEIAVAAKQRVRSVLLVSQVPLAQVRRVALDTSSRTSQALVKILFAERYGRLPQFQQIAPDAAARYENMLAGSDAALIIGDPAMQLAASPVGHNLFIHDLAQEWRGLTGLPFVFAVWAVRADAVAGRPDLARHVSADFLAAKCEGLERLDLLAAEYAADLHLPVADLADYLRHNVNYELDAENRAGMQRYFALAEQHGLIERACAPRYLSIKPTTELPVALTTKPALRGRAQGAD